MLRHSSYILWLILVFSTLTAFGGTVTGKVRRANSLYADGKYQEALDKYQEAQIDAPANERVTFNLGNAQYKVSEYDQALSEYLQAAQTDDPILRGQSHYNAGNTLYRMGKLEEAVDQYLKALEYAPDDQDAKYNLEFVRREIQRRLNEQQQRREQQKQQDKDQNDKTQESSAGQEEEKDENQDRQGQDQREGGPEPDAGEQPRPEQEQRRQSQENTPDSNSAAAEQRGQAAQPEGMSQENVDWYLQAEIGRAHV